jgi:NAD(P)-dependent dehydrogenase (short-subunit alcohol dehydrogenase family)
MLGSTVLVTGAASGVGAATARTLTAAGWRVIGVDRDAAGLAARTASGDLAEHRVVDLSSVAEIEVGLQGLRVDAIANVAGVGPDIGVSRAIWAINLVAPLTICRLLADLMPAGAAIVNVSSVTGEQADDRYAESTSEPLADGFLDRISVEVADPALAYTYSKRALLTHTTRLALQLAPQVRVNAVSPGIIDTPMGQRSMQFAWTAKTASRIPAGRLGRPDEVASAIAFLLSTDSSYVYGSRLVVDGGHVASRHMSGTASRTPST